MIMYFVFAKQMYTIYIFFKYHVSILYYKFTKRFRNTFEISSITADFSQNKIILISYAIFLTS